ncbi:MAG: zinc carboxypeptidase [Firmicutes bacterium]|nr:zinc carboxypeptidase [Bacillota bacterium]
MKLKNTYDHFFKYQEITDILTAYAAEHPELCRLSPLAVTREGRNIWMIEITDLSTGDFADKPGFAVTGNIHAGEVTGNAAAMYFLDTIFSNLDDPKIADLLKDYTVYCIPRISPDGSELYLTTTTMLRSVPAMYPFEQPMPGLQPKDLDGDGVIRQMRIQDPAGAFKVDPDDPRVMIRRQPDDTEGPFYNIYGEGEILEFDPLEDVVAAPPQMGNDLNRNFPFSWAPENRQKGSGDFALSNTESRAIAEFMNSHKNICTILHFHTMGGQYLYPPGYKSGKEAHKEDMDRYKAIGEMAVKETGYVCWNVRDDYMGSRPGEILGLCDDFCHFAMGVLNYTCECWDFDARAGMPHVSPNKPKTFDEQIALFKARLKWLDENNNGEGFMMWTPFDHPQLGKVEIGGFDYKGVIQNPPLKFLESVIEGHTRFLLREMRCLPHLYTRDKKVTKVAEDTYKIEMVIGNSSYLPTYVLREALDNRKAAPIEVTLQGAEPVSGKAKETIGHLNGFWNSCEVGMTGSATPAHMPTFKKLTWVVKAPAGTVLTVTAAAPRAGKLVETITL